MERIFEQFNILSLSSGVETVDFACKRSGPAHQYLEVEFLAYIKVEGLITKRCDTLTEHPEVD